MRSTRVIRTLSVLASAALVLGAFTAAPADAKKKKKKKPPACAAYQPGDYAKDAKTQIVTDAATESAPIELKLDTQAGVGFSSSGPPPDKAHQGHPSHVYYNVQVDSASSQTGLWARLEFDAYDEYDLHARVQDGSSYAYAAGYNPVPGTALDGGEGGRSERGAEILEGIATADCGGYTLDVTSAITPGGPVTLKLWLGEVKFP